MEASAGAAERRRRRQWPAAVLIAAVAILLIALNVGSRGGDDPGAAPPPAAEPAAQPADAGGLLYLALGDSLARGVQPVESSLRRGYPRVLAASLRARLASGDGEVTLVEAGCGGATTTTFIGAGKACAPDAPVPYANDDPGTSQLAWAEAQLRARGDRPTLVTLTMGGNDLLSCASTDDARLQRCLADGKVYFETQLETIATRLAQAAGERTVLVMATYYDPVLGYLEREPGALPAVLTFHRFVVDDANPAVRTTFRRAGWEIADLGLAFHERGTVRSVASRPVRAVCEVSWACSRSDVHLDDDGYAIAADVFEAAAESGLRAAYPPLGG